jgi:transcriptional regulator PpsR
MWRNAEDFSEWRSLSFVKAFKTPSVSLGDLSADAAAALVATAADIALVVDASGTILDASFQQMDLCGEVESYGSLLGRGWTDIVSAESRSKVEAMLGEAATGQPSRWRQVSHRTLRGEDIPLLYAVIPLGRPDRYVALGRDLRAVAKLQQRLVEAQMAMERDYSRLRHVETRYRILFERSSEAVLIIDGSTRKVVEANPAALNLLGDDARRVIGSTFADMFEAESAAAIRELLADVRAAGRAETKARILNGAELLVSFSLFRHELSMLILVRLLPETGVSATQTFPSSKAKLIELVQHAPDGYVVTDRHGAIVTANAAFLDMAQLTSEEQSRGEPLDRWLGRPGIDLNVVLASLRQHGSVRLFATILRGEYGAGADVEVSAVSLLDGDEKSFGFSIRNVGRRLSAETKSSNELPHSAQQLTELIGRVPLKEIVRETADVIERLCIEAALKITGDNRASAAEMLGLSRQSLYVKLRRYDLVDASADGETHDEAVEP